MANFWRYRPVISGFVGGPGINTWHAEFGVDPLDDDPQNWASAVAAAYTAMRSFLVSGAIVTFPGELTVHDEATGKLVDVKAFTPPAPVLSSIAGGNSTSSRATQILTQLRTNTIRDGKRLQGNHFIGPVGITCLDADGQITLGARTAIAAAYGGVIDAPGPQLCVYGPPRAERPAEGDKPALPALPGKKGTVVSVTVSPTPGTLRSRKV